MDQEPDMASGEKEAQETIDEPKEPLNTCSGEPLNKLGMTPAVNLLKLDMNKIQSSLKLKLQSDPKSKNVKRIGPKSKINSIKNATKEKSVAEKTTASPGKEFKKKKVIKAPVTSPCSLDSLDEADFVAGVCLICRQEKKQCTNIFNDTNKFDHIIQRFLPISVNKNDEEPKTVCKNCLSVLIAVENLSKKSVDTKPTQQQVMSAEEKCEVMEISSDDEDSHFVDDICAEEEIDESEKNQHSKLRPSISVVPASQLNSPSKVPSQSSKPVRSPTKPSVPTSKIKSSSKASSTVGNSDIQILQTFSLCPEKHEPTLKAVPSVIISEPEKAEPKEEIKKSRPTRKIIPPAKFANFESSASKSKGKKATSIKADSEEKPSDTTEEKSINLPIETGNKKKIQYAYDLTTGEFMDECPEGEKPAVKKTKRKKKDRSKFEADLKAALKHKEQMKEYEETVHSLRKYITTGGLAEKKSQENASESGIPVIVPNAEKEKAQLIDAHNPTNLVDISPVTVTNAASKQIQNLLRLTKSCLSIKVLISDKNDTEKNNADITQTIKDAARIETSDSTESAEVAKDKSSPSVAQPDSKTLKTVIETQVEVFSNVIKGHLIPVYFKVLSESFPSEKVKRTVFTTVTKILVQKKKNAMTSLEAESCDLVPSIFKRLLDSFDPNQEKQSCIKCSKKLFMSEIVSHIKFTHLPQCKQCRVVCHSFEALNQHQYTHHSFSAKKCAVCKKLYTRVFNCQHWFRCSFCGRGFTDHNVYLKHEKKHFELDFLNYMYVLNPDLKENIDFLQFKSGLSEKPDCSLIDHFWDKENFPTMSFLTYKDKLFCIRCLQVFEERPVFKNHICHGEDKCLQLNFGTLKCCKCQRAFKSKGTFYRHYQECVDHSFNVTRALQLDSALIEIECTLCSGRYYSMEMFNNHFDDCYSKNIFDCGLCHIKLSAHFREQHMKKCQATKWKQPDALPDTTGNSLEEVNNVITSIVSALEDGPPASENIRNEIDSQEKTIVEKAVNNVSNGPSKLPDKKKEKEETEEAVKKEFPKNMKAVNVTTDVTPAPAVSSSSHTANSKEKDMDALLDESLIDFAGIVCSTPVTKKYKKAKEIKTSQKLNDNNQVSKTVPEVPAVNPAVIDSSAAKTCPTDEGTVPEVVAVNSAAVDLTAEETDQVGGTVPVESAAVNSPVIDLDAIESNLASVETVDQNGESAPEVSAANSPAAGLTAAETIAANSNGVKEKNETDQSALAESEGKTVLNSAQPAFIKKRFSIKILTTSTDGAPGAGRGEKFKSAENLDPNSKELQKLVEESENTAEIKEVLNVSYCVFFTEVSGKHLPHHFRLTTADISQAMKDKASSVIKSLLVKERKKVFKEGLAAEQGQAPESLKPYQTLNPNRSFKTFLKRPLMPQAETSMFLPQKDPPIKGVVSVACIFCKEIFVKTDLPQHILETHMVQCSKCDVYLTSLEELLSHVSIVHNEPFSTCLKCCKKFPSGEDPLTCPCLFNCSKCDEVFSNWLQYLDHEMAHFHETAFTYAKEINPSTHIVERLRRDWEAARCSRLIYTCSVCGKRFPTQDDVIKCIHTYKCVTCKTSFNSYSLLVTHGCSFRYTTKKATKDKKKTQTQQIKEAKFIHLCPICDGRFDSAGIFTAHYAMCMETSEEPITDSRASYWVKCPYCLRDFSSDTTFLRHHFDCQKANSFLCDVCDEYISNYNREEHLKDCLPEILCANCGVSFANRISYNFHFRQQRDGTIICKSMITDDDGNPFETEPDPEIVMNAIRDGTFDLKACTYCGKMFSNARKTSKHIIETHLDKVKSCPVCKMRLSRTKNALLLHRKCHTTAELVAATRGEDYGPFKCMKCSRCFNSSYHKILHQIYYHQRELLTCNLCHKEFLSKQCLHSHQITCSASKEETPKVSASKVGKDYICQTCDAPFTNFQDYAKHKKTHASRYSCDICQKTFLRKHIMRDHKKRIHFGTPSTCEICGSAFGCLKNLRIHQRNQHTEHPPVICETCGKSFKTRKHLRTHTTLHTGEKPYACSHCDRRFRLKQNLTQHEFKHSKDPKPFTCPMCPAKFTQFNNLHLHKRQVHPESFKYMCIKCKCGYNDVTYFMRHVQVCDLKREAKAKKHFNDGIPKTPRTCIKQCPYCNESVDSLRIHLLRRTDDKPYFCQTCPKKFSYPCGLKHHELQHFNSKKFKCKFCDKGFLGLKQYSFHLQMKHNDLFPMHCAHCSRGYNENKFYYRHIQQCNQFIVKPRYHPNSKKLIPQCTVCDKIFIKFNDLRIHAAMVHKSQSHKKYQCQICDSAYDSNALLVKHAKHHFKDRCNPGMFLCPKCQFQHHDFKTVLNHNCPFLTNLKDMSCTSVGSPSKRASSSNYTEPAKKSKSSRASKKSAALLQFVESDDEDDVDFSDDDTDSDADDVEVKRLEDIDELEDYNDYNVNDILVQPSEVKVEPDALLVNPENVIEETVTDNSNFIYHCSFCKENFDTLAGLQSHLRKDHGFDLNNLEFQVL